MWIKGKWNEITKAGFRIVDLVSDRFANPFLIGWKTIESESIWKSVKGWQVWYGQWRKWSKSKLYLDFYQTKNERFWSLHCQGNDWRITWNSLSDNFGVISGQILANFAYTRGSLFWFRKVFEGVHSHVMDLEKPILVHSVFLQNFWSRVQSRFWYTFQ